MINQNATLKNLREIMPDLSLEMAIRILDCIVEDVTINSPIYIPPTISPTYPWETIKYTQHFPEYTTTCTIDNIEEKVTQK